MTIHVICILWSLKSAFFLKWKTCVHPNMEESPHQASKKQDDTNYSRQINRDYYELAITKCSSMYSYMSIPLKKWNSRNFFQKLWFRNQWKHLLCQSHSTACVISRYASHKIPHPTSIHHLELQHNAEEVCTQCKSIHVHLCMYWLCKYQKL